MEEEKDWVFTFCNDHKYPNNYVVINGTFASSRKEIFTRFENKWGFQYDSKEEAEVEKYNLIELKI